MASGNYCSQFVPRLWILAHEFLVQIWANRFLGPKLEGRAAGLLRRGWPVKIIVHNMYPGFGFWPMSFWSKCGRTDFFRRAAGLLRRGWPVD